MRATILVLILMMTIPYVQAVGVATMETYSSFELDVGDEEDLFFIIKGDERDNVDVTFFMQSEEGTVTFNGNPSFSKSYVLDPYEQIELEIELKAVGEGEDVVEWGYREPATGSGLNIDSVTSSTFTVDVEGENFDVEVDVEETSNSGSSGGSGGGSGGGSSGFAELVSSNSNNDSEPEKESSVTGTDAEETIVQDIAPQNGAVNEVTVDESAQSGVQSPITSNPSKSGQGLLTVILLLGLVSTILTSAAVYFVRRGANE